MKMVFFIYIVVFKSLFHYNLHDEGHHLGLYVSNNQPRREL